MDFITIYGALIDKIKNTPVSGDISVDSVTLSADPVQDMQVTTKKYVDDLVAGGVEVVTVDGVSMYVVGNTLHMDTEEQA